MNKCVDCGVPVGLRRRRCDEHRKAHRAKLERERVARGKINEPEVELDGPEVITARPAHRNPREVMARFTRRPEPADDEVIDYTQGGSPRPSIYERPAPSHRHRDGAGGLDYTGSQLREAARNRSGGREPIDWTNLAEVAEVYSEPQGHMVDIRSMRRPGEGQPRYDSLGRPYSRAGRSREKHGLR